MTTIASSLPVYTPPPAPVVAPSDTGNVAQTSAAPADTTSDTNANPAPPPASAATNANETTSAIYTALANVSAPTIRGTSVNIAS